MPIAPVGRVLPRDTPVVVELDHDVVGGIGDAALHRHAELVAELDALRSVLGLLHRARTIDVVMPTGIGEQREDRLGRCGDRTFDGFDVTGLGHGRQRTRQRATALANAHSDAGGPNATHILTGSQVLAMESSSPRRRRR